MTADDVLRWKEGSPPMAAYLRGGFTTLPGYGWSADGGSYTDEKGYVWSAEAAILNGIAPWPHPGPTSGQPDR